MKFDKNFGYTRDLDRPHSDDEGHPNKGVMVEFYHTRQPMHDERGQPRNDAEGTQLMSEPVLMMAFHTVGDPKTLARRKATEADKREWRGAFDLFQKGQDFTKQAGTPIDVLPDMDIMNRARLNAQGYFSTQQLATLSEANILGDTDLRNWVNKARTYELANKPKPNQALLDEMAALRAELDAMKAQAPTKQLAAKAPRAQEGIAA